MPLPPGKRRKGGSVVSDTTKLQLQRTQAKRRKVDDKAAGHATRKQQNRHVYAGFAQRIKNINATITNNYEYLDHTIPDETNLRTSYLLQECRKWRLENKTADFDAALRELLPLVRTMPHILHHLGKICSIFDKHLRKEKSLALEPLLGMLPVLARDTRGELMPYFVDTIFGTLVWLLETRLDDPDAMEWIFQSMGYLFKCLSSYLLADAHTFTSFVAQYEQLLSHKRSYIRQFASESLAYLLRRSATTSEKTTGSFGIVLDLSLKTPQLSDSVAIVITEACKGVGTIFHTKARPIVQTMLQWTRDNNSKDSLPSTIPDEDTTSYTLVVNVFKRLLLTCQSSIPVLLANFGDLLLQNLPPVREVEEWVLLLEVLGSVGKAYTPNTPGEQQNTQTTSIIDLVRGVMDSKVDDAGDAIRLCKPLSEGHALLPYFIDALREEGRLDDLCHKVSLSITAPSTLEFIYNLHSPARGEDDDDDDDDDSWAQIACPIWNTLCSTFNDLTADKTPDLAVAMRSFLEQVPPDCGDDDAIDISSTQRVCITAAGYTCAATPSPAANDLAYLTLIAGIKDKGGLGDAAVSPAKVAKAVNKALKRLHTPTADHEPAILALCIRLCPQSQLEEYAAATAGSIECSSGVLEALHYRGWTPDSDEAIANLIHACADTRGPVREAALSLLLAKWPQSTPISCALSMEATGPLGIDTERERMIRIGRLAESITTNTQASKEEISVAAKVLVAEYSVPLSTLWPSTTTALSKLVSDDPNGPTAKTRRSEVWQALKESIQSVWPLMARQPVHDDGDEQMASEESMADRALVVAKAAGEETQVAGSSTRHQQLCRAIAAVIGASPQMRKEKSEENQWLVTSCLDVLKGRYEYDTTVGGPTASVAQVSDLLDCLITVAKDRAFICPEAMEGELSRMAVDYLLGDSSLGHDKRRAGMATIGLQLLLQCRGWKDTLKKYKKEILMLTDDKTFRDGLLKIPLGEGGDQSVDEDDTVNRIADEDRPKVVTVIYCILLGKLSAKGGGIDKHGQTQATRRGQILTYIAGGRVEDLAIFLDAMEAPLNGDLRKCCIGYLKALKDVQKAMGARLSMHVPRIGKGLVSLWSDDVKGAHYDAEFTNTVRKLIVQLLCGLLEKHPKDADYGTILLPLKDDISEWMDGMAHAGESSLVLSLFLSIASDGALFHLFNDLAPNFLPMVFVNGGNSDKCLNDACRLVTLLLRGGSEAAGLFKIAEDKLTRRGVSYQKATRLRRRRLRRHQGDDREDEEEDEGAELRALEEVYSDALKEGEGIIKKHIDEVLLSLGSSELGNPEVLKALTILAPLCEREATATTLVELLCAQLETLKGRDKKPQDVAKAAASILDTLVNGGLLKMWSPSQDNSQVSCVLTRALSTVAGLGTRHQIALALGIVYERMGKTDQTTVKVSELLQQLTAINRLGGEPDFDKQVDGLNLILGPACEGVSTWWWVQAPILRHMLWQLREPTCDFGVRRLIEDALCKCSNDRSEDTTLLALVRGLIIPWSRKLLDHPAEVVVNSGIRIIAAYCTNMAPFAVAQGWDEAHDRSSTSEDDSGNATWAQLLHVELIPLAEQGTLDDLYHLQKSRQHRALVRILALEDDLSKSTIAHLLLPLGRYHIRNSPDDHDLVDVSTGIIKLAAKDLSWTRVINLFRWLGGQLKPGGVSRKGLKNRGIGRRGLSPEQVEKALLKGVSAAVQGLAQRDDLPEKISNLKSTVLPTLRRLVYSKQKTEDEAGQQVGTEKQPHHQGSRPGQQDTGVTVRVSMVSAMLEVLSLMDADVFGSEFNKLTGVVVGGLLSRELEDRRKARDALSRMAAAATSLKQITFMLRTIRTRLARGGYQTPVAVFTASKIIDSATLEDGEGVEAFLKEVMGIYAMEEARWLSMQGRAESTQGTEENPMLAKQVSEAARPKANAILEAVGKAMPIEKVLDGLMKPLYGRLIGTELDDVREGAWSSQHAGGVGGARFARRVRTSMLQLTSGILESQSPLDFQQCQRVLTRAVSVLEDKCDFEEADLFSANAAIIDPESAKQEGKSGTMKTKKEEAVTVLPGAATGRGAWVSEEWKKAGTGGSTQRYDATIRGSAAAEVGLKLLEGLLKRGGRSTATLLSDEGTLRGVLSPVAYFITVSKVDDVFVPAARSLSRLISCMKYSTPKEDAGDSSSGSAPNNPLLEVLSAKETLGIVRSVLKMVQFYSAGASLSRDLTVVQAKRQQSTHSSAASSIVATCTKLLCSLLTGTVGIIKCNEELLLALLAHVELCVNEHPKLRMSAMTMLRRVIMPRVSPPSEASTKRTKSSGKAGHSQLVVQLYTVCNVVLENLLCGAGGTYYNDDSLGALCGQIVCKWLIDYPHTTQSLTAKIASLVRVAAACANSPNPTCAPPTRRYCINALHSLALQMPAEVLKEFSLMLTLTSLAGAAGETDDRCRSMLRELVKVVVEKVHLRPTLRGKVISWSKADNPKLLGAFGEFCLTCADSSDAGIVAVLREAVIRLGQISSSSQQLSYWHTLYELLIAFEAGGYHKAAGALDENGNAFMQLALGPAGTQAPHPWVRLAALRTVTEYCDVRNEWTIPESAVDTELLNQFGDSNKHSATDSYVPEGAIPRLTAACYSPFAGEHPEVASASVRATVAVLSCAQRDQSSRTEIVSDEEAEDEEDVNEEVDDTDVEETDEDVEPSTESAAADGDGKASAAADEEDVSDTEDAGEGVADMGLLAEDEHHNDEDGGDGDIVVELPPESSARVPPRLRWLLVRTSYETRKLLAAYKRSGGIVRLGALLKLVCASAVLVTPDVLCSDEAGLLKPLLSTLVRISTVRPAQEGEDQIGQASSLTDLAKLRPYTGIRRVCAIANQAVESMGKWIRKAGGATLYNKWNTELVEMRGIVVRSRQKRRADEKADAIVNPQETAERRLAKRAVKVEKRKRAMKEKVQEWRGLKQRKL